MWESGAQIPAGWCSNSVQMGLGCRFLHCYDNALAENFFGILKTECIYRHKPETFEQANKMIDDYIYFYNHERIQLKTGLTPLTLRQSC